MTLRRALIGLAAIATLLAPTVQASAAPISPAPKSPDSLSITYYWTVINKVDAGPWVDVDHPLGKCANPGSTCTIAKAVAVTSTITTALGYSKYGVAANIGYSIGRTETATVSCTSPKLASSQAYWAYDETQAKEYRIQEWRGGSMNGFPLPSVLLATSGFLVSLQPYPYPDVVCRVQFN